MSRNKIKDISSIDKDIKYEYKEEEANDNNEYINNNHTNDMRNKINPGDNIIKNIKDAIDSLENEKGVI